MKKAETKYYYFLQRLEHEYADGDYRDLAQEFTDNKWVFHGCEIAEKTEMYRWQYEKKQFVNVLVDRATGKVIEVIL